VIKTSLEWLENFNKATGNISLCSYQLQSIANALYAVGNDKLADKLIRISYEILENDKIIMESMHTKIGDDVKQADAMTGTIFRMIVEADNRLKQN